MTDKIKRGEEAERLLKNEVLAEAFGEVVKSIRATFFDADYSEENAKLAHVSNAVMEHLRHTLRRYVGEARGEAMQAPKP